MPLLTFTGITVGGAAVANVAAHAADLSNTPFWDFCGLTVAAVIAAYSTNRAAKKRAIQQETPDVAKKLERVERKQSDLGTQVTRLESSVESHIKSVDQRFDDARKSQEKWNDEIMTELRAQRSDRRTP